MAREKIDVITLHSGDRLTGEIKDLDLGVLSVKTDHMGTVAIEWVAVKMVETEQLFEVTEIDGERYFGAIGPAADGRDFQIESPDDVFVLTHDEIVRVAQIEEGWTDRWNGFVDFGAYFASANTQNDVSLSMEASYRSEKFSLKNTLSGSINDRDDTEKTSRGTLASTYRRSIRRNRFWYSELAFTRNQELNLDLRATVSGGLGRYVLQTPRSQFSVSAGISALRESYYDLPIEPLSETPSEKELSEWSSEAVFSADYNLFIFTGRETSLTASLSFMPSLTVRDRYRVEFSSSFRRKLVRDFTISLTLEESYDSQPPQGAESSDTRIRTSLGWSF
ncbi:MAG: DUF481 domain-containing protein [bacterium]|nr:DUF481 domain-containing protein [bacterium]